MPHNKNQHWVPQFYFRFFSKDGKNIGVFNLKDQKHYFVPFNTQSSKGNFYSRDKTIEKAFGDLEAIQSTALRNLLNLKDFKKIGPKDYSIMLSFLTFQESRTNASKIQAKQTTEFFVNEIIKPLIRQKNKESKSPLSEEEINNMKITRPADHLEHIKLGLESHTLISDLIPILLINKTKTNFIFGDNPVVLYNLFFSQDKFESHTGLQSFGLQIFCPLSNDVCLFLFDPGLYDVIGSKKNIIELDNLEDINKLNSLQFHNCDSIIYYSDAQQNFDLSKFANQFLKNYPKQLKKMRGDKFKVANKPNSEILRIGNINIKEWIEPSFVKIKKLRNQKLIDFYMNQINQQTS